MPRRQSGIIMRYCMSVSSEATGIKVVMTQAARIMIDDSMMNRALLPTLSMSKPKMGLMKAEMT